MVTRDDIARELVCEDVQRIQLVGSALGEALGAPLGALGTTLKMHSVLHWAKLGAALGSSTWAVLGDALGPFRCTGSTTRSGDLSVHCWVH
jgi:hypothetical protein